MNLAILVCVLSVFFAGRYSARAATIYNFDGLTSGDLTTGNTTGQDGWYRDAALGGPPDLQVVTAPSGSPTSNVLSITYGSSGSARGLRQFGTTFFTGTETNAQLSFTFQKTTLTGAIQLALGNGATPTSYINGNAPADFGPKLIWTGSQFGIVPKAAAGAFGTSVGSAQTLTNGDWYTVTLTMDFTANSGSGSGSISYVDLTTNQVFNNVVSGVNLGLTNNGATFQSDDWNQAWLRMDQLTTGGPTGTMAFSNFTINTVPEPNSLGMAFLGLCLLSVTARYRKNSEGV